MNRPSHHDTEEGHDHDDFDTFDVELGEIADVAAFVQRLAETSAAHDVLRAKGYVAVAGKPMRLLVQGVGQRIRHEFDRAWRPGETRASRLVVIGEKGIDRAGVEAMLRA